MHRIYTMKFGDIYPLYLKKVERKGHTKAEVDEVTRWLTGFTQDQLDQAVLDGVTFEQFFAAATLNPHAALITGSICGVKIQEIEEPLMKQIRYLDKLVDEVANGRPMAKILRSN